MEKLRVCPFCGGNAVFDICNTEKSYNSVGVSFKIMCKDCGIKSSKAYDVAVSLNEEGEMYILKDQRGEAIKIWNMRAGE